jgi:hypothetical protein
VNGRQRELLQRDGGGAGAILASRPGSGQSRRRPGRVCRHSFGCGWDSIAGAREGTLRHRPTGPGIPPDPEPALPGEATSRRLVASGKPPMGFPRAAL